MFAGIPRATLWVAAGSIALLLTARFYAPPHRGSAADAKLPVLLATPPGITLQLRTKKKRVRVATTAELLYADGSGMALYTYEKDTPRGTTACAGKCAEAWPPALAPPTAAPDGDWSLLTRTDGAKQWMYAGAPLYTFANDKAVGDAMGDAAEGGAWHVAAFHPGGGTALPDGIAVREIADAAGAGLVDSRGMTLYTFDGDAMHPEPACGAAACARLWVPLDAPQIAGTLGQFSVLARRDGITQWAYRGKPLYRFGADQMPGDVNGSGIDARYHVALVVRYFMPADVTIRRTLDLGNILTTLSGATLYQRDRVTTAEELHQFRTDHGSPELGRAFGTSTCDDTCAKTWRPLPAPADALPSGYWDVLTRPDGTRQWAFKGFALYTYTADQPGETNGNGIYMLQSVDDKTPATSGYASGVVPRDAPGEAAAGVGLGAMFWHAVVP